MLENNTLKCKYFAQSSGTTSGIKKILPTPEFFVRQNHLRGSWYSLHTLYEHNAEASVFKFKNLLVGGSIYERRKGYLIADVSGIMLNRIPYYMRPWYVPSIQIATMPEWEEKIQLTTEAAVQVADIALLGGIPTWLLVVCRQALEKSGKTKISDLWPHLVAYVHGGVNFEAYRSQFEDIIDIPKFRYLEVYNASEGFFGYQDRPNQLGMLLMLADGIYYEFIPYRKYKSGDFGILSIGQVTIDESYVILITTSAGLVRYVLGDIVTFVTTVPYRVMVTGRINEHINAFGEDMMRSHVDAALQIMCNFYQVKIRDFTIAPHFITIGEKGWHDWYIEFVVPPEDVHQFALALDIELCRQNDNYKQKRTDDLALKPLRLVMLPSGTIDNYFRSLGKIGGQSKLQKMRNDRHLIDKIDILLTSKI